MGKSFNELSGILKSVIIDANSDAHNSRSFNEDRYSNIKLSMEPQKDARPHVTIKIGMSEAKYDLTTGQREDGSLGPDERYVGRWFNKMGVKDSLEELWQEALNRDKEQMELRGQEKQGE